MNHFRSSSVDPFRLSGRVAWSSRSLHRRRPGRRRRPTSGSVQYTRREVRGLCEGIRSFDARPRCEARRRDASVPREAGRRRDARARSRPDRSRGRMPRPPPAARGDLQRPAVPADPLSPEMPITTLRRSMSTRTSLERLRRSRTLACTTLLTTLLSLLAPLLPRTALAQSQSGGVVNGTTNPGNPGPTLGAANAGSQMGQTDLSVPEAGPASASASLATGSVDPATGAFSASIPFVLPPARGAVQPQLALTYSSAGGVGGVGGAGWSLSLPAIERQNPSGFPQYAGDPAPGQPVNVGAPIEDGGALLNSRRDRSVFWRSGPCSDHVHLLGEPVVHADLSAGHYGEHARVGGRLELLSAGGRDGRQPTLLLVAQPPNLANPGTRRLDHGAGRPLRQQRRRRWDRHRARWLPIQVEFGAPVRRATPPRRLIPLQHSQSHRIRVDEIPRLRGQPDVSDLGSHGHLRDTAPPVSGAQPPAVGSLFAHHVHLTYGLGQGYGQLHARPSARQLLHALTSRTSISSRRDPTRERASASKSVAMC